MVLLAARSFPLSPFPIFGAVYESVSSGVSVKGEQRKIQQELFGRTWTHDGPTGIVNLEPKKEAPSQILSTAAFGVSEHRNISHFPVVLVIVLVLLSLDHSLVIVSSPFVWYFTAPWCRDMVTCCDMS
mmetsp:Transcript_49820/g.128180  ORF Transcript_49820/g.128180 Transcript_49820/m.128180 type:complete len:128 (-) Transcript_49820:2063-2446(-)